MKRIIIADVKSNNNNGRSTGHYFSLAQNYLELYNSICNVKIAGGPIYKTKFQDTDLFKLPYDNIVGENPIVNKWRALRNCYTLFRKTSKNDIIVLQHSGIITTLFGIFLFGSNKHNIYIIQYNTEAISSPQGRFIYRLTKRKIRGVLCPNDEVGKAYKIPYCVVTDYIYTEKKSTPIIGYKQKQYDFCIVGSIWPDKGVVEVAKMFSKTNYSLLIAGKPCNEEIKNELINITKNRSNIELRLEHIPDKDYYDYIQKSKYCILNYQGCYNNRSSGVILDILFNQVPVIAKRCNATTFIEKEKSGYLYNNIEEFNPNFVLNETIYNKYMNGIKSFLSKQEEYKQKIISFFNQK